MATVPSVASQSTGASATSTWANSVKDGVDFLTGESATNKRPLVALRQTTAQTIATGSWTAVTFDSEDHDSDGMHSTATNTSRVTAVLAGWYQVNATVSFTSNATGARGVGLRKDSSGSGIPTEARVFVPAPSGSAGVSISGLVYLAAGSYVEAVAWQDSGGNLDTLVSSSQVRSQLQAVWVRS